MEIVGYEKKYCGDVIRCLKRNFKTMENLTDDYMEKWLCSLTEYSWQDDIPIELFPYKYGMVLIENDEVIGYCGLIYSKIEIDGHKLSYVNTTTWAIDAEYRLYVLKATKEMIKTADIVSDFSAIDSMEEMNRKMFKYRYLEQEIYKYLPSPAFSRKLKKRIIKREDEINTLSERNKYIDHLPYGVKCLKCELDEDDCYVFYRRTYSKIKNINNVPYIQVLDVSNYRLLSDNLKEIVWYLARKEKALFEIDSRFLIKDLIDSKPSKISKTHRQVRGSLPDTYVMSNLYSEMAILKQIRSPNL